MRIEYLVLSVFFFECFVHTLADSALPVLCKDIESDSSIMQLKRYLFCDYDQEVRPTNDYKNATTVRIGLIPQSIEVSDASNVIDLHSWTSLTWKDGHLTWEPSNYDNIKWLHVKSYEIWVPDITVHNAGDADASSEMPYTNCWLYHKGDVYCVPATVYKTHCTADHTWWPYDAMNCTVQFGSWSYSTNEIEFAYTRYQLTMEKYENNLEWDTVRAYMTERVEFSKFGGDFNTKLISYHIILKRHASMFSIVCVMPAIVLMTMTMMTLWLEPNSAERMLFANLSFICHLLCIHNLHWLIPPNGSNPPKLLLFYEGSFILTSISLILTSVLRHIQEKRNEAPLWISTNTASILQSKVGQILLISVLDPKVSAKIEINADDNTNLVCSNKTGPVWKYVAILIGWVAFFVTLITYLVLLAVFLPTSSSGNIYTFNS